MENKKPASGQPTTASACQSPANIQAAEVTDTGICSTESYHTPAEEVKDDPRNWPSTTDPSKIKCHPELIPPSDNEFIGRAGYEFYLCWIAAQKSKGAVA